MTNSKCLLCILLLLFAQIGHSKNQTHCALSSISDDMASAGVCGPICESKGQVFNGTWTNKARYLGACKEAVCGCADVASDKDILLQNTALLASFNAQIKAGPQAPRSVLGVDKKGNAAQHFTSAPSYKDMNLCDIHFHKNAEHKGEKFKKYAGNGDGKGNASGYKYSGEKLSTEELKPLPKGKVICADKKHYPKGEHKESSNGNGSLVPGDTIEVHYVYSSFEGAKPEHSLSSCNPAKYTLSDKNAAKLRVEAQVMVLVNDSNALNFKEQLTKLTTDNNKHQVATYSKDDIDIDPLADSNAVEYQGSTTGPSYNEKPSPYYVTWRVRSDVIKVDINSVGEWCKSNDFEEHHAHGVRNLVTNTDMISHIE